MISKSKMILFGILLVLNILVLIAQVIPDFSFPFSREITIGFLSATLIYFVYNLLKSYNKQEKK